MNADQLRAAALAKQIQTADQAFQLLDEAYGTAADVAARASELPLIDGGSRQTISDGLTEVMDYGDRIRVGLSDPLTDKQKLQVATVVAQMESWLAFVDGEVKGSPGFLQEWLQLVPTYLKTTVQEVADTAASAVNSLLGGIPWYVYAIFGGGIIVALVLMFKKGGAA